jgi:hypothetical protein
MRIPTMKRSLSLSCLLLMVALSAAFADSERDPIAYAELRQEAETAYRDRDGELAKALFLELTVRFPGDPEVWFGLSRAYEWTGDVDKAIETAERVQALGWVSRPTLSYRLAQLNAQAGREDAALDWIEHALADGYEDRPAIKEDEAFASLRDESRFIKLAGILPANTTSRDAGLKFDIDYLVEEAQRMHAGPDRPAFSDEFLTQAAALKQQIPALSDAQVLGEIMRLLAVLGDGHTAIYGPGPDTPLDVDGRVLPLKFYWFAEGVYVVDGIGRAAEFAGSRVLKIGDITPEEALQRMSTYRGLDNAMMWKWMGPQFYLGSMQMLELVGAANMSESITLELQGSDGTVSSYEFEDGFERPQRKLRPSPAASGPVPLYLTNIDTAYWLQLQPERNAVYFQFNQVRNSDDQSIEEFSKKLGESLRNSGATNLIIDVRHNNGGNNSLLQPLIRTIISFEQEASANKVFVISGRNTFSAAQNFVTRMERWTNAVFVGEPSSSRPNFVGEETNLLLPYSNLGGSISTQYWQDSDPGDDRRWIVPTIPVDPTAADYFSGRDAALEAVYDLIATNPADE